MLRRSNANNSMVRRTPLVRRTPPTRKRKPPSTSDPELKAFYDEAMESSLYICEQCGEGCYSSSYIMRKSTVAHLLPKKTFESVRAHPSNKKCLGGRCGCHNKYDKNWKSAVTMKIWPDAERIILTELIPLLPAAEYSRLPAFLKEKYEGGMFHVQQ